MNCYEHRLVIGIRGQGIDKIHIAPDISRIIICGVGRFAICGVGRFATLADPQNVVRYMDDLPLCEHCFKDISDETYQKLNSKLYYELL